MSSESRLTPRTAGLFAGLEVQLDRAYRSLGVAASIAEDLGRDHTMEILQDLRLHVFVLLDAARAASVPPPPSDQLVFNWEREQAARRRGRQSPRDPAS